MSTSQNEQYLNLLAIFHYVFGGMKYVFGCIPMIHFVIGILMLTGVIHDKGDEVALRFVGLFMILFSMAFISVAWIIATLVILAGRNLARRTRYTFCMIIAAIECISMPLGTILGVFTIILLCKPEVKQLFEGQAPVETSP